MDSLVCTFKRVCFIYMYLLFDIDGFYNSLKCEQKPNNGITVWILKLTR